MNFQMFHLQFFGSHLAKKVVNVVLGTQNCDYHRRDYISLGHSHFYFYSKWRKIIFFHSYYIPKLAGSCNCRGLYHKTLYGRNYFRSVIS